MHIHTQQKRKENISTPRGCDPSKVQKRNPSLGKL